MRKLETINVSVEVGYELRTVSLTELEWKSVQAGETLTKGIKDYYEGEEFTYEFHFNSEYYKGDSLVVTYDDGDGFIGSIEDAYIDEKA